MQFSTAFSPPFRHPGSATSMPVPTGRFALLVALTGLGFFAWPGRSWIALLVVEVVLLTVFVGDAFFGISPKQIVVFRDHPSSTALGEVTTMSWTIENHARTSAHVTVADALWPSLRPSRRSVEIHLAGRGRHVATAELWPSRRGRFPLDDVTVRVRTPLGFSARQRTRVVSSVLRVLPAFPSRNEMQRRMRQPRVIDSGIRSLRVKGASTDFDQLREYQPGDDSRRIDWSATARLQKPIVRQFRAERNQTVIVLLDNGRIMAGLVDGAPRVEHAMDAALSITHVATHLGDKVGMVSFDQQVRTIVPASNSKAQRTRVAEAMYLLQPDLNESAYNAAFIQATARFRRRSLFVLLTDLVDSAVEEAILPALPILSRRHLVVVAAVSDPDLATWATGSTNESVSDAFRQAAAVSMLQQRRRSMARLRAAGALVVDAPPGHLSTQLVETYLDLKASGRL